MTMQSSSVDPLAGQEAGPSPDECFYALLGMAEHFRQTQPPRYRLTIHYLTVATRLSVSPNLVAVAHFHLGRILHLHTTNVDMAEMNLEQAYLMCLQMVGFDEIKVQTASYLAEIYMHRGDLEKCQQVLRQELDTARSLSFWKCRFLFQLAEVYLREKNVSSARQILQLGGKFCQENNIAHTEMLFRLSEGLLVLHDRTHMGDLRQILASVGDSISTMQVSDYRKESLKAFYLFLQVAYMLLTGLMNSAAPALNNLQQVCTALAQLGHSAQSVDDPSVALDGGQFEWVTRDLLTVLVFTATAVHAMHVGQVNRVHRYVERAMSYVDRVSNRASPTHQCEVAMHHMLAAIRVTLLEHSAQTYLIAARPTAALTDVHNILTVVRGQPTLWPTHEAVIHTLLGLYAMHLRQLPSAEAHLNNALRTAKDMDLWTYANLNLALYYVFARKHNEFNKLVDRIKPERLQSTSTSLRAAANFVQGLHAFSLNRQTEAKRYLKDCLSLANKEEIMRVSAMALVLLGNIYLQHKDVQETSMMLTPALDVFTRMPDLNLQTWATTLLKEVYLLCAEREKATEGERHIGLYRQRIQANNQQAMQAPHHHQLIDWYDGPMPTLET